ncbi:MAG: amino acid adenylation domain-containing protein [Chitinispirillaceae bacterium]|nr:amino acid adenylation domain-containing protein [Chitinispirillaceae bacterium]
MSTPYKTSFQQRQFLWLHNFDKDSSVYNIPLLFTIDGQFDTEIFKEAFTAILSKCTLFNSVFVPDDAGYSIRTSTFPHNDTFIVVEDQKSDADTFFETLFTFISAPFDLKTGPLYRSILVKREEHRHIWCIVFHHSICDLQTKELLCESIGKKYQQYKNGIRECDGSNEHDNYSEFALFQNEWVGSEAADKMKVFWKTMLKDFPDTISLPVDFPRPKYLKLDGTAVPVSFDEKVTFKIREFSKKHEVTPFLCLFTAYTVLLSRYSGEDRILIGVPFTNRRDSRFKMTPGCFVNTLPIPAELPENCTGIDLMKKLRKMMLLAHRNQELPTELIVREVVFSGNNTLEKNPLYQAGFTFEPLCSLNIDGCDVKQRYIHHGGSQLDIFATFWEDEDTFQGVFEYNEHLFKHETVSRWVGNFIFFVENFIDCPDKRVQDIPLICNEEKVMIDAYSKSQVKIKQNRKLFPEMFEDIVKHFPSKPAVLFNNKEMSYRGLYETSMNIRQHLVSTGAGAGKVVAVLMERSDEMLAAITGILLSGAAYLPLDPQFPSERKKFILDDSNVTVIITDEKNYPTLKDFNCKVFVYNEICRSVSESALSGAEVMGDNYAYIIYTSGSTGNPKGVTVTHHNLSNFIHSMMLEPGISSVDKMLAVTTISFDIHVLELLLPLATGATIVIAPSEAQNDAAKLNELFISSDITIMQATPATWKMLCASGWEGRRRGFTILCGGESMSRELSVQLLQRCSRLFNMYGPTETTVWSTCYQVNGGESTIPIGKAVANTVTSIIDTKGNVVPLGVWGEMLIGGDGVSNGYHNRETLTKEKFLTVADGREVRVRFYRTGDLCRMSGDGLLECAGRLDNQIKLRGYRIELEEIEHIIESYSGVKSAAVIVYGQDETAMLVAFIVSEKAQMVSDFKPVREYLVSKLPSYMVPSRFIAISELPMTPNRKVDRKVLKNHNLITRPEILSKVDSYSDDTMEKKLIEIWAGVLHLEIRDLETSFFDAGGNSLLLVKLKDMIFSGLGSEVSVPVLLQYPTIRSLAKYLKSEDGDAKLNVTQSRVALQRMALKKLKKN